MMALGLGLRAALARTRLSRFFIFVVVGAVATGCFVAVAMAPVVKVRENGRLERARSGQSVELPPTGVGPYVNQADYHGRAVMLVQVPPGVDRALLPPAFGAPPQPGEVRLSPALAERVEEDPVLATWFPYERGLDVAHGAVGSAGEYSAYIGVRPEAIPSLGGETQLGLFVPSDFGYFQWIGFLVFIALPAAGLLAMSGRFGRRARRERYASLRLLGMPALGCRTVLGIETGLPVALGAVAVGALAALVRPDHVVLPLVERWVFGEDTGLSSWLLAGIVAAVVTFGVAIGAATPHERSAIGRLRAVVARADVTRAWTVIVYAAGLAITTVAWVRVQPKDPLRFVGVLLVGVGIPGAVAVSSKLVARILRWTDGPLPWFLAMRKLQADPRSLTRVAGLTGVVVFVVGISQPIAQLVAQPDSTWVAAAREAGRGTVLGRAETGADVPLVLRGAPPASTLAAAEVVELRARGSGRAVEALVSSCQDLETLVAQELPDCLAGRPQRLAEDLDATGNVPSGPLQVVGLHGQVIARLPVATSQIDVPPTVGNLDVSWLPDLLVPPEALAGRDEPFVRSVYVRVPVDADAWVAAEGWIIGSSPAHRAFNEFQGVADLDSTGNWIILGLAFAAGVAALGAILISIEERGSLSEWAALRALGASAALLVQIRMIVAGVTAISLVAVAVIPALLVSDGYLKVDDDRLETVYPFVTTATVGACTVLVVTMVSAVLQVRRLARTAGRD